VAQPAKSAPVKSAPVKSTKDIEPEAKPPQAPADPVFTSFTAEPADTPAIVDTTESDEPAKAAAKTVKPKPVKPAKVEEKINSSANGDYLLQAGVFADMENAKRQLGKLTDHQIDAHVESKVRIGPFAKAEAAQDAREKIESAGINVTVEDYISSKGLLLQSGILTDMDSAKQLQDKLGELGLAARVETRILVGPFDTKAKADAVRSKIKALNISVVLM
jgi:cell division protein FtsN